MFRCQKPSVARFTCQTPECLYEPGFFPQSPLLSPDPLPAPPNSPHVSAPLPPGMFTKVRATISKWKHHRKQQFTTSKEIPASAAIAPISLPTTPLCLMLAPMNICIDSPDEMQHIRKLSQRTRMSSVRTVYSSPLLSPQLGGYGVYDAWKRGQLLNLDDGSSLSLSDNIGSYPGPVGFDV